MYEPGDYFYSSAPSDVSSDITIDIDTTLEQEEEPPPAPGHHGHHPPQAFGYGHIDPYLNHKQGYGYSKGGYAGYNSVYAPHHGPHHVPHHAPLHAPHHAFHGVGHHGLGVAHHLPAGYGAGYGAPQPFVGSGFR